ncbi:monocarboxylate transporter 4-like [Portunus trituberculatus]|uniref:monocarboxylate transporter 4-like n=1 Tax=Portunus trituberculatus TaxID=210409 RepID=UPI001E1CC0B9|nr:monocarboxylate transporter 4-like [Portunus trituberculatus]
MDKNVEAALSLHEDPKTTKWWRQEKELEQEEDQEADEEENEEYYEALSWEDKNWPLVLSGFVINILASLGSNNLGMLFMPRLLELGLSQRLMSGTMNISLVAANLLCIPATPLLHRWGCRRLLLLVGCVYSTAFSLAAIAFSMPGLFIATAIVAGSLQEVVILVVQVTVSRCFKRRRPLAVGMTGAGISINQIMGPPLIAFMQSHYNPRTVMLVISILMLQICVAASLMPSGSDHGGLQPANRLAMVRRREVVILCLVIAITSATMSTFSATVPLALLNNGCSPRDMVPYLSMSGVANLVARVAIGLLLCHLYTSSLVMRVSSALSAATIPVWFWCKRTFWRVAWLSLCRGSNGVVKGLISLVTLEVVGLQWQAEVLSLINLTTGIATLLVGQLTDLPQALTKSYASKFYTMTALLMMTQLLWQFLDVRTSEASPKYRQQTADRNS